MRKLALSLAVIGLAAAPIAAQTADTSSDDSGESSAVSAAPIIAFALAAIAVGIFAGSDDDEPVSA